MKGSGRWYPVVAKQRTAWWVGRQKSPSACGNLGFLRCLMFVNGYEQSNSGGAGGIRTRGGLL